MRTINTINTEDPRKIIPRIKKKTGKKPVFTQECFMTLTRVRNIRLFTGTQEQNRGFFSERKIWLHEFTAESRNHAVLETRAKAKQLTQSTGIKHKYIA